MEAHLSAYDARQMVGRCRNAGELHVWLSNTRRTREESPEAIYNHELEKGHHTSVTLNADGVPVPDVTDQQHEYLRIHARVQARRNASINSLREHFQQLSVGYWIEWNTASNKQVREKHKLMKELEENKRKAQVLTVPPVNREEYDRALEAGMVTEELRLGLRRSEIESTVGQAITPALRDKLWKERQRSAVRAFVQLITDESEVKLADAQEALAGMPLPRRQYQWRKRAVRFRVLQLLLTPTGECRVFTQNELDAVVSPILARFEADLRLYFGWRPDRCKGTVAKVRLILRSIGLNLSNPQKKIKGKKVRTYHLDQVSLHNVRELGTARLDMLRRQREKEEPSGLKSAIGLLNKHTGSFEAIS